MYRVNAFTQKGTRFRFRIEGGSILDVHTKLDMMFRGKVMKMVLVERVKSRA
jgi:hypothetical protein